MPTKIRLQRKGKKGQPFYQIVIADGRAPRDGKYIERIGSYNPITKPAEIELQFDRALHWLQVGAQPTDTVRAILTHKGVMYKNHLLKGIKKGALTQEQVDVKFDEWLKEKEAKISGEVKNIEIAEREDLKKRFEAEKKINEDRAKELAAKQAKELKLEADENAEEAAPVEEVKEDAPVKEVKEDAPVAEVKEEVKEEVAEEPKVEEKKEEAPKAEAKKEEDPKAEAKEEDPKKEDKEKAE